MMRLYGCVVVALIFASACVGAEDASKLRMELQTEVARLDSRLVELRSAKSALLKKDQEFATQWKELHRAKDKHDANLGKLRTEVARLKGDPSGDLTARINKSNAEARRIDRDFEAALDAGVDVHARLKKVEEEQRTAENRMVILREQIKRLHLDEAFLIDPNYRDQLSKECMRQGTDEGIVACMQRIFDGAKK